MIRLTSEQHAQLTATLAHKPWLKKMMGRKYIAAALEAEPVPAEAAERILRVLEIFGERL
jgi:hypothetical protein